ncbi:unnamed protein product [Paramecium sonneborni]|uniref:Uncharacterized protein n=1 Tax=Paramecium sonneborni TaxID=65129 RepID=A0A8S1P5B2_9CILI|nr:unnamed protein product [Paramecium sonneborni]
MRTLTGTPFILRNFLDKRKLKQINHYHQNLYHPKKQYLDYEDFFDQKEQIYYLSFKQQTIIKRLLNLRDNYKLFLNNLQSYQDQLIQSISEVMKKVSNKRNQYLQEQEYELRQQLSLSILILIVVFDNHLQNKIYFFKQITNKLSELNNEIFEFFNNDIKKNFSNLKESSSRKKYNASPSQFKDIDRILQIKKSSSKPQFLGNNSPQNFKNLLKFLNLKLITQITIIYQ